MKSRDFLKARILYPELGGFVDDDGHKFTKAFAPFYNELLDLTRVNASIQKMFFGSCTPSSAGLNCTDALKEFQLSNGDLYILPTSILLLGAHGMESVLKVGPTAYELVHAIGSVTPSVNSTKTIDLIDSVKADKYSIGFFFILPFIIYIINYLHRKLTQKYDSNVVTERGSVVLIKLIRIILNQPNYSPSDPTMRLMISFTLLSTFFVLTVYRNMFGSDLTVSDSAVPLDTIEQFNDSDRFVIYDQTKMTKQLIFSASDPLSTLFQARTVSIKSDWGMLDTKKIQTELDKQRAVTISSIYYHTYFDGSYCLYKLNNQEKSPVSRYHVSKDQFFPTVTAYVYGHNISSQLESRFNKVIKSFLENGIEQYMQSAKPRIAFFEFSGSEEPYLCTTRKVLKEESVPPPINGRNLRKTGIICGYTFGAAMFVLILEKFTKFVGSIMQNSKKKKKKKKRKKRAKQETHSRRPVLRSCAPGAWVQADVITFDIQPRRNM